MTRVMEKRSSERGRDLAKVLEGLRGSVRTRAQDPIGPFLRTSSLLSVRPGSLGETGKPLLWATNWFC